MTEQAGDYVKQAKQLSILLVTILALSVQLFFTIWNFEARYRIFMDAAIPYFVLALPDTALQKLNSMDPLAEEDSTSDTELAGVTGKSTIFKNLLELESGPFKGAFRLPTGRSVRFEWNCNDDDCVQGVERAKRLVLGEIGDVALPAGLKLVAFKTRTRVLVFSNGLIEKRQGTVYFTQRPIVFRDTASDAEGLESLGAAMIRIASGLDLVADKPEVAYQLLERERSVRAITLPVIGIKLDSKQGFLGLFALSSIGLLLLVRALRRSYRVKADVRHDQPGGRGRSSWSIVAWQRLENLLEPIFFSFALLSVFVVGALAATTFAPGNRMADGNFFVAVLCGAGFDLLLVALGFFAMRKAWRT